MLFSPLRRRFNERKGYLQIRFCRGQREVDTGLIFTSTVTHALSLAKAFLVFGFPLIFCPLIHPTVFTRTTYALDRIPQR